MLRNHFIFLSSLCFGFIFGSSCNSSLGDAGGAGQACNVSQPCNEGFECYNGLCAEQCQADTDCAASDYCDIYGTKLCQPRVVTVCPDVPCADGQVCANGFCTTTPSPETCDFESDPCKDGKFCLLDFEHPDSKGWLSKCYSLPACGENGQCPVGYFGSVCNDDLFPPEYDALPRACIPWYCTADEHCPAGTACTIDENFGICLPPCEIDEDCQESSSPAHSFNPFIDWVCDVHSDNNPQKYCQPAG